MRPSRRPPVSVAPKAGSGALAEWTVAMSRRRRRARSSRSAMWRYRARRGIEFHTRASTIQGKSLLVDPLPMLFTDAAGGASGRGDEVVTSRLPHAGCGNGDDVADEAGAGEYRGAHPGAVRDGVAGEPWPPFSRT